MSSVVEARRSAQTGKVFVAMEPAVAQVIVDVLSNVSGYSNSRRALVDSALVALAAAGFLMSDIEKPNPTPDVRGTLRLLTQDEIA